MVTRRNERIRQGPVGELVTREQATAINHPLEEPVEPKGFVRRRLPRVMARGLLAAWITVQITAGFLVLPYTRLLYYGLDQLAKHFPSTQRWRLLSETRVRYERWRSWCRQRSAVTRFGLSIVAVGSSAFMWWLWAR